jgi:2-haloacid dehalogenase
MTSPHALIFDFGGVLVDWNPHYLYRQFFDNDDGAVARFLQEIGFYQWNLQMDAGRPFDATVAELGAQFPQHAHLIRAYHERWPETLGGPIQPSVDILRALKAAGYPLYGLTNWSSEKFKLARPNFGFFDWFDTIVVSGDVALIKPDPRIFELCLQRISRVAGECAYIDDSASNVTAAQALGFSAIHFESPARLDTRLKQIGFRF